MARRVHKGDPMPTQAEFLAARPTWSGLAKARDLGPKTEKWVLHAGPPFENPADIPAPVRNSVVAAIRFEGWATDDRAARALVERGAVTTHPAQDFGVVTPLAFPVSPSMTLMRVGSSAAPFNEGGGEVLRLGSPAAAAREILTLAPAELVTAMGGNGHRFGFKRASELAPPRPRLWAPSRRPGRCCRRSGIRPWPRRSAWAPWPPGRRPGRIAAMVGGYRKIPFVWPGKSWPSSTPSSGFAWGSTPPEFPKPNKALSLASRCWRRTGPGACWGGGFTAPAR